MVADFMDVLSNQLNSVEAKLREEHLAVLESMEAHHKWQLESLHLRYRSAFEALQEETASLRTKLDVGNGGALATDPVPLPQPSHGSAPKPPGITPPSLPPAPSDDCCATAAAATTWSSSASTSCPHTSEAAREVCPHTGETAREKLQLDVVEQACSPSLDETNGNCQHSALQQRNGQSPGALHAKLTHAATAAFGWVSNASNCSNRSNHKQRRPSPGGRQSRKGTSASPPSSGEGDAKTEAAFGDVSLKIMRSRSAISDCAESEHDGSDDELTVIILQRWSDLVFKAGLAHRRAGLPMRVLDNDNNEHVSLEELLRRKSYDTTDTRRTTSSCLNWLVARPMSPRRLLWDMLGVASITYDIVMFPLQAFNPPRLQFADIVQLATAIYWLIDMPSQFIMGFHGEGYLELRPREISKRYLRTWFLFDFTVVFLDWSFLLCGLQSGLVGLFRMGKILRIIRILRALRLLRLGRYLEALRDMKDAVHSELILLILKVFKLIGGLLLANHLICCGWYFLACNMEAPTWITETGIEEREFSFRYLTALHWSLTQFTPASMEVYPRNSTERCYAMGVLLLGMISLSSFVSNITNTMNQLRQYDVKRRQEEHNLRQFMSRNRISADLSNRMWTFIRHSASERKARLHEDQIGLLKELPRSLRVEMHSEVFAPTISGHPLFKAVAHSTMSVMERICHQAMSERNILAQHDIFLKGHFALKMYFISQGIARYSHVPLLDGPSVSREVQTSKARLRRGQSTDTIGGYLAGGDWVSECALWCEAWAHEGWLVALTHCEVMEVDGSTFRSLVRNIAGIGRYKTAFLERMKALEMRGEGVDDIGFDRGVVMEIASQAYPGVLEQDIWYSVRSDRSHNILKRVRLQLTSNKMIPSSLLQWN